MVQRLLLVFALITAFVVKSTAVGSFVAFKDNVISIKINATAFQNVDETQFTSGKMGLPQIDALNSQYKVQVVKKFFKLSPGFINDRNKDLQQWFLLYFQEPVDPQAVASQYSNLSDVLFAEPIAIHEVYKTPNDTQVGSQWHLNQSNDADIDAFEAWDVQTGNSSIIVAVLDTGVEWFHKDLAGAAADETNRNTIHGNIWINENELPSTDPQIDEDGNGYNDDWVGWDFVTGNPNLFNLGDDYDVADNDPRDGEGHGTHCAGNVGAINNNGLGVGSAAGGWGEDAQGNGNGVKIMALRIGWKDFPSGRVSMDFAAQAFLYAADNGARIASCSWGSSESQSLADAVNTFLYGTTTPTSSDPKIRLIFVAAGNDGNESQNYLNSRNDCISVAATTSNDNAASFTNYGTWINIAAPGDNILSTDINGGYATLSGTSMATPISASVAALIWSQDVSLTADQVENYLYQGADNIDATLSSQYIGKMGAGRVNAFNSVSLVPVNHAPVAVADTAMVNEDDSVKVAVLSNDSDADGDSLSVSVLQNPVNGSVQQIGDTLKYTPNANFFGADSFSYQLSDQRGGLDTAMVRVTVQSVNDAPQIVNLPADVFLNPGDCTSLYMVNYQQDVDTPDSLLQWSFSVSDSLAISYTYDNVTDSLQICSLGPVGTYYVYCTLTDDQGAFDLDTIAVHVDNPSAVNEDLAGLPRKYDLKANFPNPFNPVTTISYQLPEAGQVKISVYNVFGQKIATLVNKHQSAGYYRVTFDGSKLASGVYFYRMQTQHFEKIRKMILMK